MNDKQVYCSECYQAVYFCHIDWNTLIVADPCLRSPIEHPAVKTYQPVLLLSTDTLCQLNLPKALLIQLRALPLVKI
jgi:hypothetical protein